jgi:hypothetical protein
MIITANEGAAVIAEMRPAKALHNTVFAFTLTCTLTLIGAASMSTSVTRAQAFSTTTTGVIVILTAKAGVTREQVMAVMPAEIRETVQLYLNGKIREWYSRGDGRGVVFLLFSSAWDRRSRFGGGTIPRMNLSRAVAGIL